MSYKLVLFCLIILGLGGMFLSPPLSTHAQEPTPENDANCVSCHEHQYYLYDTGKWFCLCKAPMHCVYCHSGRTDTWVKEEAHEGLVLYPTRGHAERCQECHGEDYMSRVVTFETIAGVSLTPLPIITATPMEEVMLTPIEHKPALLIRLSQLEPWRLVGLGFILLALIGVGIFGYRCWKADCLSKLRS